MWFGRLYTLWSIKYTLAEVQPSEVWATGLTKPECRFGQRGSACGKLTHLRRVEDEEEATWRPSPIGDQSGLDLDGGDVLGSDNEIEPVSSEGDEMVDAAADLEIEKMSLQLASVVDGVRPNGVKTQKKKARTDGDLPLGADALRFLGQWCHAGEAVRWASPSLRRHLLLCMMRVW